MNMFTEMKIQKFKTGKLMPFECLKILAKKTVSKSKLFVFSQTTAEIESPSINNITIVPADDSHNNIGIVADRVLHLMSSEDYVDEKV